MKFLIHIPQLIYGGAEKVLVDFSNYLVEKGHEVHIIETYERGFLKSEFNSKVTFDSICSNKYTEKYYVSFNEILKEKNIVKKFKKGLKKIFITIIGYERLAYYFARKRYKNKEFDVAINYLETQSPNFIIKSIKSNKYLQWIHIDISKINEISFIDKQVKLYKKLDNIICVSEVAKLSFDERYVNLKSKTVLIYNFYDVDKIKKMAEGEKVFDSNNFNILSVGRLVEQKGYERSIEVVYMLKQEGYKFKWYIIGEGVLRREIEKKIEKLKLEDTVYLLGIKKNPYPYIKQCSLFFLPSLYEGFSTVTIEAKILEKPVLSTQVSGIKEQIINNETGIIVDNNIDSIYYGMKNLIENNQLREFIKNNKKISKIIDNHIKYIKLIEIIEK